jgi:hypothetical protein
MQLGPAGTKEGGELGPPGEGDPCPLCLQEVGRAASERMSHFEQHVKSEVHATAIRTAGALEAALRDCEPDQVETSRAEFLERLRAVSVEVTANIDGYLERAVAPLTAIAPAPSKPWPWLASLMRRSRSCGPGQPVERPTPHSFFPHR